jgi:hypothetical protein
VASKKVALEGEITDAKIDHAEIGEMEKKVI